jgi:hypothetical protein
MADPRDNPVPKIIGETRDPEAQRRADDWIYKGDLGNWREYVRPLRPGEKPNQSEEPPEEYNKGGMVKHGSDTRVVCKNKFS